MEWVMVMEYEILKVAALLEGCFNKSVDATRIWIFELNFTFKDFNAIEIAEFNHHVTTLL